MLWLLLRLVARRGKQHGISLGEWHFSRCLFRFLLLAINQKRIHLRAKTKKLLDWLACGLVIHLAKNLKAIECFDLNVQFAYS